MQCLGYYINPKYFFERDWIFEDGGDFLSNKRENTTTKKSSIGFW